MPYIDALIFTRWVKDAEGAKVPNAISDIFTWAMANDQEISHTPKTICYGKCMDVTAQKNIDQRILDNMALYVANLIVTVATAAHFANDPRIWTLGYKRFDDDGEVVFSNWDTPLTAQEQQQAAGYITSNSGISAQQLAKVFSASDTRLEIAKKLKAFFRKQIG